MRFIQEMLGNKSSNITELYTLLAEKSLRKIQSPQYDL